MKWNQSNMNRARDDVHMGVPGSLAARFSPRRVGSSLTWLIAGARSRGDVPLWIEEAVNIQF